MASLEMGRLVKLKIRSKLIVAFIALSAVPVLIVGITGIVSNTRALREIAINNLEETLAATQRELDLFYSSVEGDISFIVSSATFAHFANALQNRDSSEIEAAITELTPYIMSFTRNEALYYQIRFISSEGLELFGIEDRDGTYVFQRQSDLNKTATRYYLYIADNVSANSASFQPTELRSPDTKTLIPTISCVYKVVKQGFTGILVLQIYAESFFGMMESDAKGITDAETMIVNREGFYLFHSRKKTSWNQLSASQQTMNLSSDFGKKTANAMLSKPDETIYESGEKIVAQTKVFTSESRFVNDYTLIISVLKRDIFKSVNKGSLIVVGLLFIFLISSFGLALMATNHFINPINSLIEKASTISKGDYKTRVEIQTHDEIQELARQFNIMAGSLKQREEEINRHKESLEKMVLERTEDLANEKNKLQTIFDFAPNGFILYDSNFKILSVSAAIKTISGLDYSDIIGENYLKVFKWNHKQRINIINEVRDLGRSVTDYTSYEGSDGKKKFHEHILIPVNIGPEEISILEIITDITQRKRLQDMLIHSERLAATGELAAVIAHEMRNSLTSVKMIIQLLSRNEYNTEKDVQSLQVALDSLNRMEQVVNDLLRLASPSDLEKTESNINEVLNAGIEFVMPQLNKQSIDIVFIEEDENPLVTIDSGRMKEVIINLLINACQAIEKSGKIIVEVKRILLDEEIRDYIDTDSPDDGIYSGGIREINLEKDEQVYKIVVSDNGHGMSAKQKDRIFSPFFTTKANGTGLGLTFVKRVVNQHNGIINVESKTSKGSKFIILLPATERYQEKI